MTKFAALLMGTSISLWAGTAGARITPDTRCLLASGKAAAACVKRYTKAVGRCRDRTAPTCEAALRTEGGTLDRLVAATEEPTRKACSAESANKLTFLLGLDDLVFRTGQACETWAEDFLAVAYADDLPGLSSVARVCQHHVARQLGLLRDKLVRA